MTVLVAFHTSSGLRKKVVVHKSGCKLITSPVVLNKQVI